MNAFHAFLTTQVGLAFSLAYRIVAFLALCICASCLGTIQAATLHTRAQIVAFAAAVLASARNLVRLAMWAVRHVRGGAGARQAGDDERGISPPRTAPGLAEAGSFMCLTALPRRVRSGALPPARLAVSLASDGNHDSRQWPIPVEKARAVADRDLSTGNAGGRVAGQLRIFDRLSQLGCRRLAGSMAQ